MVHKSLSVSSTVVQTVEELFDALSALPPLVHCRKCGSRLLQRNATFFSYGGRVWNLPLPVCTKCEPTQFSRERADTNSLWRLELNPREKESYDSLRSGASPSCLLP
jgi:hypothetical protein